MLSLQKLSSTKLNLDANEYHFPPHIQKFQHFEKNIYPRNSLINEKLLKKISQHINVPPNNIILTNGSQSAIDASFRSEKGNIVIATPTFSLIEKFALINNRDFYNIDILNYSDLATFENKIYSIQPETIYISNPSTPLGILIDKNIIQRYLSNLPNTLFVVDEAYIEYTGEKNSVSTLTEKYNNLIVTRTFSKFFGCPNIRIGYIVCNNKHINKLNNICSNINVNDFSRLTAIECLDNYNHYNSNAEIIQFIKKYVSYELSSLNIKHHISPNSISILVYNNEPYILSMILKYKFDIITKPLQIQSNNAIRVTLSTKNNMLIFISALKESLDMMNENIVEIPLKYCEKDYKNIQDLISINETFICNIPIITPETISNSDSDKSSKNIDKINSEINAEIKNINTIEFLKDSQIHKNILELGFEYDRSMKMTGRKKDAPLHRDGTNKLNILHQIDGESCEFFIIPEEERFKIKKQSYRFNGRNELLNILQNCNIRVFLSTTMKPGDAIIFQSEFPHALIFPGITTFLNYNYRNTLRNMIDKDDQAVY